MNYYQELTILPDTEISPYFIWQKLYTQLHIALADVRNKYNIDKIGVSFPNYRFEEKSDKTVATLGNKLRIFAPEKFMLEQLNLKHWLKRLNDHVHIKTVQEVGDKATSNVIVKRYQHKNKEKQAKEFAEFKGISYEQAMEHCIKFKKSNLPYPYINLKSEETQQSYKLSIIQKEVQEPVEGTFNTHGINTSGNVVTVPHW